MILGAEHCCTCKGVYDLCCVRLATAPQLLPLTRLTGQMYPQSAGSAHGPLIPDRETCPAESSCLLLTETNMCTAAFPPPPEPAKYNIYIIYAAGRVSCISTRC